MVISPWKSNVPLMALTLMAKIFDVIFDGEQLTFVSWVPIITSVMRTSVSHSLLDPSEVSGTKTKEPKQSGRKTK